MYKFEKSLDYVGEIATHQNLAYNLLYWMSFVHYYSVEFPTLTDFSSVGKGQLQFLQLTGNPKKVFDLTYHLVRVTSPKGYE
jgi:hypothetical protein